MTERPKLKTRCYYTEYVNHMIRFYLTTPDTLNMDGKRSSDISNWLAVQSVMRNLKDADKQLVLDVYSKDYKLQKAVDLYCHETGSEHYDVWKVLTKVLSLIARQRGLV